MTPGIALSPARMRARRRAYSASITGTESIGPVSAASAAYCAMDVGFDVDWLCILIMASISGLGAERVADAPAGHREGLRERADDDDVGLGFAHAGDANTASPSRR